MRVLLLLLSGCVGGLTTGAVMPLGPTAPANLPAGTAAASYTKGDEPTGVEVRVFGATGGWDKNPLMPNAYGVAWRQIGDEHMSTSGQLGWAGAVPVGSGFAFGRVMFDILNSQRTLDGDRKFSAFSPTIDVGIAPLRNGLCFSVSGTYDVHFNDPDRMIIGAFVGVCASEHAPRH
jgi:hypothetical protein